jgi:hypothetical protein
MSLSINDAVKYTDINNEFIDNLQWMPSDSITNQIISVEPSADLVVATYGLVFDDYNRLVMIEYNNERLALPGGKININEQLSPSKSFRLAAKFQCRKEVKVLKCLGFHKFIMEKEKPENYAYPYPECYTQYFLARVISDNNETTEKNITKFGSLNREDALKEPQVQRVLPLYELACHHLSLSNEVDKYTTDVRQV